MLDEDDNMVPEIRFKGFQEAWDLRKIHELLDDGTLHPPMDGNHGEIHPKKSDYVDRGIPFVMANNVRDGEVDLRGCSHITKEQADTLQKGFAKSGDVLLTHKGTVGEMAIVGAIDYPFIMLTPQVTFYRILKPAKLDTNFLATSFATSRFQNAIEEVSGGGTRAYVGITQQQQLSVTLPPDPTEQTQIGAYFKSLDRMIGLYQRKHDKLVTLKQAMLQKMFPQDGATIPEIRFKGYSRPWEENAVRDICGDSYGGGTPATSESSFWKGEIPWIQSSDIKEEKLYSVTPRKWINESAIRVSAASLVPAYSIAVITRVGVGKVALIEFPYATSQDFCSLSKLSIDPEFAVVALSLLLNRMMHQAQGTSIKGITKEELLSFVIPIPIDAKEQRKVGSYFRSLDMLIRKQATQLEKLKNIKSASLEKMFV